MDLHARSVIYVQIHIFKSLYMIIASNKTVDLQSISRRVQMTLNKIKMHQFTARHNRQSFTLGIYMYLHFFYELNLSLEHLFIFGFY